MMAEATGLERRDQRRSARRRLEFRGRIVWQDAAGRSRTAPVRTRDISEQGAFVECLSGTPISLYRLVSLRLDRSIRKQTDVPRALRQGPVLSAVYRVGPTDPKTGTPSGYALRLLIEPARASRGIGVPAAADRFSAAPAFLPAPVGRHGSAVPIAS